MDLKSGSTLWSRTSPPALAWRPAPKALTCDIAIIGGGISGALIAHALIEAGQNVVVIDKRRTATGSTSASTALLLYQTDASLAYLVRTHGSRQARRIYRLGKKAIRDIERTVRRLKIDCGFSRKRSLYFASDAAGLDEVRSEYRRQRRWGFPVKWLRRKDVLKRYGFDSPGAIYSSGAAQFDPMKFVRGLFAHHSKKKGLRTYSGNVRSIRNRQTEVHLRLDGGKTITAKQVVLAPGYESAPFLKKGLVSLRSTYVLASKPLPPGSLWSDECLIWETARPYCYLRTTPDRRILIGGGDERFIDPRKRDARLKKKRVALENKFAALFPRIRFETDLAWAGTFGETKDGLPLIGTQRSSPRIFFALGYGGNGITFSQIAAAIIRDRCLGKANRDADLFRFDRSLGVSR